MDLDTLLGRLEELIRGRTRRLRRHERSILGAIETRLDAFEAGVLQQQLAALPTTQRSLGGRMVLFAFDGGRQERIPLFANRDDEHCLARVRFESGSSRNVALLIIHDGRLSSLEFRRTLAHLDPTRLDVKDVVLHVGEKSVAGAADRLEHGSDDR